MVLKGAGQVVWWAAHFVAWATIALEFCNLRGRVMASIFVSCPFHGPYKDLIACIRRAAAGLHLQVVSVDQYSAARPLADDIQREIQDSRIVVADITGNNPNVLNEIGLAQASRKALILITQDSPSDAPANIRNLRIVQYSMTDLQLLQERVADGIQEVLFPSDALRSMIVPRSLGLPSLDSRVCYRSEPTLLAARDEPGRRLSAIASNGV